MKVSVTCKVNVVSLMSAPGPLVRMWRPVEFEQMECLDHLVDVQIADRAQIVALFSPDVVGDPNDA
jgi:hypothetical protein